MPGEHQTHILISVSHLDDTPGDHPTGIEQLRRSIRKHWLESNLPVQWSEGWADGFQKLVDPAL
jgi:hypothetical protein